MNPFKWSFRHQLALFMGVLIGGLIGLVVGYFAYVAPGRGLSFDYYSTRLIRSGGIWWILAGGLVGLGVVYICRLLSEQN